MVDEASITTDELKRMYIEYVVLTELASFENDRDMDDERVPYDDEVASDQLIEIDGKLEELRPKLEDFGVDLLDDDGDIGSQSKEYIKKQVETAYEDEFDKGKVRDGTYDVKEFVDAVVGMVIKNN